MPTREKIQLLSAALDREHDFRRRELAEVWAELLEAAKTEPEARAFIDSFGGDGDLLFGAASLEPGAEELDRNSRHHRG